MPFILSTQQSQKQEGVSKSVPSWDIPTRLAKWALVFFVINAWISNEWGAAYPNWHVWNGYCVLILVVFRLLWGVFGGRTARFENFLYSPRAAFDYAYASIKGVARPYLGHNPLGSYMVLALLTAVTIQALSGLYAGDSDRLVIEGPFANTIADSSVALITKFHHLFFKILLLLITIHIIMNVVYQFIKKDPLITAMVTGEKPANHFADMMRNTNGRGFYAFLCFLFAIGSVLGTIFLIAGRI